MKRMNRISLLTLIREHGPISRSDLAGLSRLSKPTVSAQVESLIQRRLVLETGLGESGKRGKKPTHLEFNSDYCCLAAGEIDPINTRLAITNLRGVTIVQAQFPTEPQQGAASVIGRLQQGLAKLLKESGQAEKLCRLAIAAPGRVDVQQGVILEAANLFSWKNVPIADPLSRAFKVPVFVDNTLNLAALAEMDSGAAKGVDDFVLVHHDTGIGCGVVLGGKLHRGSNWAAGEIAHFVLDLKEAGRDWTPRGYLELEVGADRLAEKVRTFRDALVELREGGSALPSLYHAAQRGHSQAREVVGKLVLELGIAIANIAATYDPSLIVLQGEIFPLLLQEIEPVARRHVTWLSRLVPSKLGEDAGLRGAIVAARAQSYEAIAKALGDGTLRPRSATGSESGTEELSRARSAPGAY